MKSSLVSYHSTPYKALALPADGSVAAFEDIGRFQTGAESPLRTRAELSRDGDSLWLKVSCFDPEPEKVITDNVPGCASLWSGDILEIFFGAVAPEPWQIQLCVGAGGGRFDSQGRYDEWSARTERTSFGWQAEIRIPLSFLMLQDLSVGFELCRQSPAHGEVLNWAVLKRNFHEAENYGELFFCDYDTAFLAKTGTPAPHPGLSRPEFESLLSEKMTPAWQVIHGPFLLNPDCGRVSVSWSTAGMCGALLEYRQAGETVWRTVPADERNGVLEQSHSVHRIELDGLTPGARYEYRLKSVCPVAETLQMFPADGSAYAFTAFTPERTEFSFGLCSDLHSNEQAFRELLKLPRTEKTDFWVMLGDYLSHASGPETFYTGFLDTAVKLYAKERPLVFVRGNHEQIGLFAADYGMLGHFSGHTWYLFRQGGVCFAALDAGNDHPDEPGQGIHRNTAMTREEAEWLARAAESEAWKNAAFRVVLVHIPPYRAAYDAEMTHRLLCAIPAGAAQPDLLLSGHVHKYFRIQPGEAPHTPLGPVRQLKDYPALPYPVIANDTCTGLFGEVTADTLTVSALLTDGTVIDSCRIHRRN